MDNSIGVGDVAALVTAGGIAIYVLGLVGLAVPIYRTVTHDIAASWYAVTLMPRTVVAGQGVRVWIQWPFLITTAVYIEAQLLSSVRDTIQSTVFILFMMSFLAILWWKAHILEGKAFIGALFLSTGGGGIVGIASALLESEIRVTWIILLFFGSLLVALPLAMVANPPLPQVEITTQAGSGMKQISNPVKGSLVAHSEGFWHLFDETNVLLSISNEQVLVV